MSATKACNDHPVPASLQNCSGIETGMARISTPRLFFSSIDIREPSPLWHYIANCIAFHSFRQTTQSSELRCVMMQINRIQYICSDTFYRWRMICMLRQRYMDNLMFELGTALGLVCLTVAGLSVDQGKVSIAPSPASMRII